MISVLSTTQDAYKALWSSPDISPFMEHSKPERPTARHTYPGPLTDPTSIHYLPAEFPLPSQHHIELKLPEKPISRKRKASDADEYSMSQPFQRVRREEGTIDPQTLQTSFTAASYGPGHYASATPTSTSSYSSWQATPLARTTSAPMEQSYSFIDSSSSGYPSQRTSVTSTGSQSMGSVYANQNPFQSSYSQVNFPQTTSPTSHYAQAASPESGYPSITSPASNYPQITSPQAQYSSTTYQSGYAQLYQPPPPPPPPYYNSYILPSTGHPQASWTLDPSKTPRPRPQSHPAAQPPILRPVRTYPSGEPSTFDPPKPKPQCWEHGCNGREFSTFSNLLRHQRERRGTAPRAICPRCGAEFTRSTARTNHLLNSKCKSRRGSSGS